MFIVWLSLSSSLARVVKVSDRTKYQFFNDEPCMVRPTLIDLNPKKLYPFRISLDKCNGSCNVLSLKICVPKETKDINVKAFSMITKKNETRTVTKHTSCDCKCKFNSTTSNSNQKWNNCSQHTTFQGRSLIILLSSRRVL